MNFNLFLVFLVLSFLNITLCNEGWASSRPLLVLATAEDFAPYAFKNTDGNWEGIDFEFAQAAFHISGVQFSVKNLPRKRITQMLHNKTIDGLLTTTPYNDSGMLSRMWLSEPIYTSEVSIFALKSRNFTKEANLSLQLARFKLGVLAGYAYQISGLEFIHRLNSIEAHRDEQLIRLLKAQRVDLVLSEDLSFIYQARKMGIFEQVEAVEEVASRPIRIALLDSAMTKYPGIQMKLNEAIVRLLDEGVLDKIVIKYLALKNSGQ